MSSESNEKTYQSRTELIGWYESNFVRSGSLPTKYLFGLNGSLNSQGTPGRASGAAIEYGTLASGYTGV